MQQVTSSLWQDALKDAVEETDPRFARTKLARAEFAVFSRIHGFVSCSNSSEVRALFEALETIQFELFRAVCYIEEGEKPRRSYAVSATITLSGVEL